MKMKTKDAPNGGDRGAPEKEKILKRGGIIRGSTVSTQQQSLGKNQIDHYRLAKEAFSANKAKMIDQTAGVFEPSAIGGTPTPGLSTNAS